MRICALTLVLVVALSGCEMMNRISEGAYRNAVADGTIAELQKRGIRMNRRPDCTMTTATESVIRVHCTGRTATGTRVKVTGEALGADTKNPTETYIITVDGQEPLRLTGFR